MRAILFEAPRKIRLLDDVPAPKPKAGEVLVQCSYIALCGTNMGPYTGDGRWGKIQWPPPPGWLGHENIGTIVESDVADWPVGTHVLAHPEDYNGFAEYIVSKPVGLAKLPSDAPDLAALVVAQPLATVLRALVRTGPVIRQRCAVVGQGPMGLVFTHLLGRMGASQVIGIDRIGAEATYVAPPADEIVQASAERFIEAGWRVVFAWAHAPTSIRSTYIAQAV